MQLTTAQLQTLKAWVNTNAAGVFEQSTADSLNAPASPGYRVWRTSMGLHDYVDEPDVDPDDGTTPTAFVYGGAQGGYIARTVGERDAFMLLFNTTQTCKPHLANVKTAIEDAFSGTGTGAQTNRKHFRARAQRLATVAEKLFAVETTTGPASWRTGNRGTRTNPDTLTAEGDITLDNLISASNS